MQPMISIRNLSKNFGGLVALDNVSLDIFPGEILAIVGDNGAGKSTLIKMISGVYQPTEGKIYLEGKEIENFSPAEIRELGIETIYQDLSLAENLNVYFNIFMGREKKRRFLGFLKVLDEQYMEKESEKVLSQLNISIPSLKRRIEVLSGGQRQCVAIARTIYWDAKLLIMDEPTAALGVEETANIYTLIRKLRADGIPIIIISHNMEEIYGLADRFAVLKNGKLVGIRDKKNTVIDDIIKMIISGKSA